MTQLTGSFCDCLPRSAARVVRPLQTCGAPKDRSAPAQHTTVGDQQPCGRQWIEVNRAVGGSSPRRAPCSRSTVWRPERDRSSSKVRASPRRSGRPCRGSRTTEGLCFSLDPDADSQPAAVRKAIVASCSRAARRRARGMIHAEARRATSACAATKCKRGGRLEHPAVSARFGTRPGPSSGR